MDATIIDANLIDRVIEVRANPQFKTTFILADLTLTNAARAAAWRAGNSAAGSTPRSPRATSSGSSA